MDQYTQNGSELPTFWPIECNSLFQPLGAWHPGPAYHISTSFLPGNIKIDFESSVETIVLLCNGVETLNVDYADEGNNFGNLEIAVPAGVEGNPQRVAFQTPWPSKKVQINISEKNDEFIIVFSIQAYSSIRPREISTSARKYMSSSEEKSSIVMSHGINVK